jgi:hypothetical protein
MIAAVSTLLIIIAFGVIAPCKVLGLDRASAPKSVDRALQPSYPSTKE